MPIVFYGPGVNTGRYDEFVRTVDIAPMIARLLRLAPSERLDGAPLLRALK